MKHRTPWTETKIASRVRKGYGRGQLADYRPWIGVRDLSSKGNSTRIWSSKTGRKMEFLSDLELHTFYLIEFRRDFRDYWEQWPLSEESTSRAARTSGFRHPIYPGTRLSTVMTVDGVATLGEGKSINERVVIDCKQSTDLSNQRTLEKLEIARIACNDQGLRHVVVTEDSYNAQVLANVRWIRIAVPKTGEIRPVRGAFTVWPRRMLTDLIRRQSDQIDRDLTVTAYCKQFESENSLPQGLGLRCIKILMWRHKVEFDLQVKRPERVLLRQLQLVSS